MSAPSLGAEFVSNGYADYYFSVYAGGLGCATAAAARLTMPMAA